MIRVKKCSVAPASLSRTKRYDGEDVKKQLLEDHHEKCYICERRLVTDFEIEHFKSQDNHPELKQEWSNLFLVCSYCNGKNPYTNIISDSAKIIKSFFKCYCLCS